jgi:hypothetical protein
MSAYLGSGSGTEKCISQSRQSLFLSTLTWKEFPYIFFSKLKLQSFLIAEILKTSHAEIYSSARIHKLPLNLISLDGVPKHKSNHVFLG